MMSKQNKGTLRENVTKFDRRFDYFNNSRHNNDDDVECQYPYCFTPYDDSTLYEYEDVMGRRNRLHPACYQDGLHKGDYLKSDRYDLTEEE